MLPTRAVAATDWDLSAFWLANSLSRAVQDGGGRERGLKRKTANNLIKPIRFSNDMILRMREVDFDLLPVAASCWSGWTDVSSPITAQQITYRSCLFPRLSRGVPQVHLFTTAALCFFPRWPRHQSRKTGFISFRFRRLGKCQSVTWISSLRVYLLSSLLSPFLFSARWGPFEYCESYLEERSNCDFTLSDMTKGMGMQAQYFVNLPLWKKKKCYSEYIFQLLFGIHLFFGK